MGDVKRIARVASTPIVVFACRGGGRERETEGGEEERDALVLAIIVALYREEHEQREPVKEENTRRRKGVKRSRVRTERARGCDRLRAEGRVPLLSPRRSRRPDSRTVAAANGITVLSQAQHHQSQAQFR